MNLATPRVRHLKYESLRKGLKTIKKWPHLYVHKVIGKNGENFETSLQTFEEKFPRLNKRDSGFSRNDKYISVTYELLARDVDEVISLWVASEELEEVVTVF